MSMTSVTSPRTAQTWDLFCRVVDNHGDLGVCWRLAADLASRGAAVRLWVDDARALAWMAPVGRAGVEVHRWPIEESGLGPVRALPADVVVEAFGCGLPEPYLHSMVDADRRSAAPVWINLEYLTAESYAERSHKLPSPQGSGAARGLTTWFFYPGYTLRTGGLLREPDLANRQAAFDAGRRSTWLAQLGIEPKGGERLVSLFCYQNPNVPDLLRALASQPTLLLTTPGHATEQVAQALAAAAELAGTSSLLRTQALPWLSQADYDQLLWCCDLNFVRGEDSLVRALWAGRPFVWQIYPQNDGAHGFKLAAFAARATATWPPAVARAVDRVGRHWNSLDRLPASSSAPASATETDVWSLLNSPAAMSTWRDRCLSWQRELTTQPDLTSQLLAFATTRSDTQRAKI